MGACFATPWATWHQRKIRKKGRLLTEEECCIATVLGVKQPEQVFICVLTRVPNPLYPFLRLARHWGASCIESAAGITLGRGIYVEDSYAESKSLIAHELVHVCQYQRSGSIWVFMVEYLYQCLIKGYHDAEWEVEAREESAKVLLSVNA